LGDDELKVVSITVDKVLQPTGTKVYRDVRFSNGDRWYTSSTNIMLSVLVPPKPPVRYSFWEVMGLCACTSIGTVMCTVAVLYSWWVNYGFVLGN
jgi:hypothetical protein